MVDLKTSAFKIGPFLSRYAFNRIAFKISFLHLRPLHYLLHHHLRRYRLPHLIFDHLLT